MSRITKEPHFAVTESRNALEQLAVLRDQVSRNEWRGYNATLRKSKWLLRDQKLSLCILNEVARRAKRLRKMQSSGLPSFEEKQKVVGLLDFLDKEVEESGQTAPSVVVDERQLSMFDRTANPTSNIASDILGAQLLPSGKSALEFVRGEPGATVFVARDLLGRSALIGLGLKAVGVKERLPEKALAAGVAIEIFVLGLALWKEHKRKKGPHT